MEDRVRERTAELDAANQRLRAEELASAEAEAYKELRREGAIPYWEMEKKRLPLARARENAPTDISARSW